MCWVAYITLDHSVFIFFILQLEQCCTTAAPFLFYKNLCLWLFFNLNKHILNNIFLIYLVFTIISHSFSGVNLFFQVIFSSFLTKSKNVNRQMSIYRFFYLRLLGYCYQYAIVLFLKYVVANFKNVNFFFIWKYLIHFLFDFF